ncbi:MAG: hypothetical protein IPN81_02030 [Nitrosomonadales bacterium]|nr:hypothetical protein [Nitrosomonadales bacterium]
MLQRPFPRNWHRLNQGIEWWVIETFSHQLSQLKSSILALGFKRHSGVRYKTDWLLKHKLKQVVVGAGIIAPVRQSR